MSTIYDVIIIGAGPAGLTAGLYGSRARLKTLILEKETIGGELMNRELIENYPKSLALSQFLPAPSRLLLSKPRPKPFSCEPNTLQANLSSQ